MLESDPAIKVIGTARDGEEAVEKTKRLKPDLVTMDVEMPRMDGIAALRQIMQHNPTPVLMVSSMTTEGAGATLDALAMGAIDYIAKGQSFVSIDIVKIKDELLAKIKDIGRRKSLLMAMYRSRQILQLKKAHDESAKLISGQAAAPEWKPRRRHQHRYHHINVIVIGASTGGPPALEAVIARLPRNLPVGVIVVQHMPAAFSQPLADRLDRVSKVTVRLAISGDPVSPGTVLIAPGGKQMALARSSTGQHVVVSDYPPSAIYKPCIDNTLKSVAERYGKFTMAAILTGMGSNGLDGLKDVKNKGGIVIAQNEATCVVYGMPKAAINAGLADHIVPIDEIADELLSYF